MEIKCILCTFLVLTIREISMGLLVCQSSLQFIIDYPTPLVLGRFIFDPLFMIIITSSEVAGLITLSPDTCQNRSFFDSHSGLKATW